VAAARTVAENPNNPNNPNNPKKVAKNTLAAACAGRVKSMAGSLLLTPVIVIGALIIFHPVEVYFPALWGQCDVVGKCGLLFAT
jgi:hypothetical protein